ncbi:MAG: SUMF1/EgtB/PvdO family nonheme iron enzyme [Candidatus Stygibacter frigidus]|nr:SUMF1/EgtB/PvdO family nonheme iron enzyme [Candidatus Stygibacter frigidus]
MKKLCLLTFMLITITLMANHAPRVEDITFIQRDDGSHIVDIYFNLIDQDDDLLSVNIFASNNEGVSWAFPITSYSGDVGENISPGSSKHIIWDFAADYPDAYFQDIRFKIAVNDGNYNPSEIFDWATVPAGTFTYGQIDEILMLDHNYEIMIYEVTNQQYLYYIEEALFSGELEVTASSVTGFYEGDENGNYPAGDYVFYDLAGDGRIHYDQDIGQFSIEEGYYIHPVVEVSWFGANAFAEHYGWRLPTEQEWEKAARGMTGYEYPWGDILTAYRANYNGSGDPWENASTETTPVGFYNGQLYEGFQTTDSFSSYGCYDMCGNVYDWTESWYNSSTFVLHGGSWGDYYSNFNFRSWYRGDAIPAITSYYIGFRCARTLID